MPGSEQSPKPERNSSSSLAALKPLLPTKTKKLGLDAEALSGPEWSEPHSKIALCFGYGTESKLNYLAAVDMTPGIFDDNDLFRLQLALSDKDVVVVAHNANYDLDLLNGVCLDHGLDPLPSGIRYIDTMNTLKTGMAYRRKLADLCKKYSIQLKGGSPDWRLIMQRDAREWEAMREYNLNDVTCTLQLERVYRQRGIPCPIKTWKNRR